MLAVNTLERNPDIGDEDLLDVLSSNLCRCTGYQNIIKAVRAAQVRCGRRRPRSRKPGPPPSAAPDELRSEPAEMLKP